MTALPWNWGENQRNQGNQGGFSPNDPRSAFGRPWQGFQATPYGWLGNLGMMSQAQFGNMPGGGIHGMTRSQLEGLIRNPNSMPGTTAGTQAEWNQQGYSSGQAGGQTTGQMGPGPPWVFQRPGPNSDKKDEMGNPGPTSHYGQNPGWTYNDEQMYPESWGPSWGEILRLKPKSGRAVFQMYNETPRGHMAIMSRNPKYNPWTGKKVWGTNPGGTKPVGGPLPQQTQVEQLDAAPSRSNELLDLLPY